MLVHSVLPIGELPIFLLKSEVLRCLKCLTSAIINNNIILFILEFINILGVHAVPFWAFCSSIHSLNIANTVEN